MRNLEETSVFESWSGVVRALLSAETTGWIFRGHADASWKLETKLQRSLARLDKSLWRDREAGVVERFKSRARLFLRDVPDNNDFLGWLSLMQHYRAPTRLLDWTESPFVGCYFAFADRLEEQIGDACLWALNASAWRYSLMGVRFGGGHYLGVKKTTREVDGSETTEYLEPTSASTEQNELFRELVLENRAFILPVLPTQPDARMVAQQAAFTADTTLDGINFPLPFVDRASGCAVADLVTLKRIMLPRAWRSEALKGLRHMNISAETLFPGLDGVGTAAEIEMKADLGLTLADAFAARAERFLGPGE